MALLRTLSLACLVALAGACAHLPNPIEKPTAEVREVWVSSASMSGMRGQVDLDVFNPNGFGVPLSRVDWELSIGTVTAMTGSFSLSAEIPAKATAPVSVDLHIDARDAIAVARSIGLGERNYTLRAVLHFSTRVGPIDVEVAHSGHVSEGASLLGLR
jgi:LEA14-like dessication related protein